MKAFLYALAFFIIAWAPPAEARHHHRHGYHHHRYHGHRHRHGRARTARTATPGPGTGIVRSVSGAVAYVAGSATGAFQCLVSSLDDAGYKIAEMGGFANGGHIRHSKHYSGTAIDINQVARDVVTRPFPAGFNQMARSCGLESGALWRNADTGHFEIPTVRTRYASSQRHRVRYAHRYARAG